MKTIDIDLVELMAEAAEKVRHVDLPATDLLAHQDEVWVTEDNEEHGWWRGRVKVKGGHKYFSVKLPIKGDREEFLLRALKKQGIEF